MKLTHDTAATTASLLVSLLLLTPAVVSAQEDSNPRRCGLRLPPCPAGDFCLPDDPDCTNVWRCIGTCVPHPDPPEPSSAATHPSSGSSPPRPRSRAHAHAIRSPQLVPSDLDSPYQACGGLPRACPEGTTCLDDPRVEGCGTECDQLAICIPDDAPVCRGFAGVKCPGSETRRDEEGGEKLVCYDRPGDGCDPDQGGADCIGVCLTPLPE